MNNHEAVTYLDKTITDLSQLYESCNSEIENRVWGIIQAVCDSIKILENTHIQGKMIHHPFCAAQQI